MTTVNLAHDAFLVNGSPTHAGRSWQGYPLEGLLLNARLVQAVFDDLNPETRSRWNYPDGPWDPERNTREFLAAMPEWRAHGLDAFTVNFQGGSPRGYSQEQPWHNSAFRADGSLRPDYVDRMGRVLDRADELGLVVILGLYYFGQDHRLADEAALRRGVTGALDWLKEGGWDHLLIEVGNEQDNRKYTHSLLRPPRCLGLLAQIRREGRWPVSLSLCGGRVPTPEMIEACDFVLLHGNGVENPDRIREMVDAVRDAATWRGQPILVNEDDHYGFDQPDFNARAAVSRHAGWGYFDYRREGEPFADGYQSVPVDWSIGSDRKRAFFGWVREVSGGRDR